MVLKRGILVRFFIYVCLFICLFSIVTAEVDVVFDRVISHGTKITMNSSEYEVRIGSANNSLVKLTSSFETIQLEVGDCVSRKYNTFCYISYDDVQRIEANLTDARPIIDVSRDVSETRLDLGETSTIELTFENTGGALVNDFYFFEKVPLSLTVVNSSVCQIDQDDPQKITLDKNLFPDEPMTCTYIVQASQIGLATYSGKYTTNKLESSQDGDAVPQVSIVNSNVFNLNIESSRYNLDMGQPFVLTFSIENLETGTKGDNLTIHNITIDLGDDFNYIKDYPSEFYTFQIGDTYRFSGIVPAEETYEQRVELEPSTTQENISVEITIFYQLGTEDEVSFTRKIPLTQKFYPLVCEYLVVDDAGNNLISLDKLNHTLPGYDRGEVYIHVYNANKYVDFSSIGFQDTGDIKFPPVPRISSLRRNDDDLLTSKLFAFDKLDEFIVDSHVDVSYKVLGDIFESSCNGNIFVEKPTFLSVEKELSFVNVSVDNSYQRTLARVEVTVQNDFFLPIRDIEITEKLPSQVFSNNNTKKTISLAALDSNTFTYDFIVPSDYVTLKGNNIVLETDLTYEIYDKEFTDTVTLSADANDIISVQEGVVLDSLIQTKVDQLTKELNETLAQNQEVIIINQSSVPTTTYSPFINYFTIAIIIFLFFLSFIVLNVKYGIISSIKQWQSRKKAKVLAKKEEAFAKKYELFLKDEDAQKKKLSSLKKDLALAQKNLDKKKNSFKKMSYLIKNKESQAAKGIDRQEAIIKHYQDQKQVLDKQIALANRSLVAEQNKKQTFEVQLAKEKSQLDLDKSKVDKIKESIAKLESDIKGIDAVLDSMKSNVEEDAKRKLLKEEKKLPKQSEK